LRLSFFLKTELRPLRQEDEPWEVDFSIREFQVRKKWLNKRPLSIREILKWADAYRETTGNWPIASSGSIVEAPYENWQGVHNALRLGLRGLPGGSSLARLLAKERGARNKKALPPLSVETILKWADAHKERTGSWPTARSGNVPNNSGEKWGNISNALIQGLRGLPGGSTLAQVLAEHRGMRNIGRLPPLVEEQILAWAGAHYQRNGKWPSEHSGPILDSPGETWLGVQMALTKGQRGMVGGSTLALLLAEKRGIRNVWTLPRLSGNQILAWADAHRALTGAWPHPHSGAIAEAPAETWNAVNHALIRGTRGLARGSSLAKILAAERGVRNQTNVPRVTRRQILAWADGHRRRTGIWPTRSSGPVFDAPGETWSALDNGLTQGLRGLQGGSSLSRLLQNYRGKRNRLDQALSKKRILAWADSHFQRTGMWPNTNSGPVQGVRGERWKLIDQALRQGWRGLPGGSSLLKLLVKKRGLRKRHATEIGNGKSGP
jgi:hypothetical protein